ncbi:hypothetical protein P154DRAFT_323424 [Amniculicola lignicola CBS 123094]|uniref:Uncharacterized protein n=1 Tax=Amniculicola lignicola CBS 123094 TaxID=1392246 RepID=A0A6A5W2V9_9PLEO|nr:hypothetical protein P154DRAFT_323424 [Amniculicola lignicola CBS 123094]
MRWRGELQPQKNSYRTTADLTASIRQPAAAHRFPSTRKWSVRRQAFCIRHRHLHLSKHGFNSMTRPIAIPVSTSSPYGGIFESSSTSLITSQTLKSQHLACLHRSVIDNNYWPSYSRCPVCCRQTERLHGDRFTEDVRILQIADRVSMARIDSFMVNLH